MINLQQTYSDQFLNQIAHEWCDDVKRFLDKKRSRGFRVHVAGHYEYVKTKTEKAWRMIHNADAYNALSKSEKKLVDQVFNQFVVNPDEFILADKDKIAEFRDFMDGTWACVVPVLKNIFSGWYTEFAGSESGYKFMKKLNIRTCPYCNRNYTFTIKQTSSDKFKTRPEFDHFYDKSEYPLLALSFYNLVPSCHTCNHAKSTKRAEINPFFDGFHSQFAITHYKKDVSESSGPFKRMNVNEALCVRDTDGFSIGLPEASESEEKNIKTFGLNELYNEHKDYVMEIIDKANAYNEIGAQNLIDAFQGLDHSPKDVFHFVWGRNLAESASLNRPLSKLTYDILQQLGINKQ